MRSTGFVYKVCMMAALIFVGGYASGMAEAAFIEIDTLSGDAGVSNIDGILTIDATATRLLAESGDVDILEDVSLSAVYNGFISGVYVFESGTLSIGSLLTAEFDKLSIVSVGGSYGLVVSTLNYTGGTLIDSFELGILVGSLLGTTITDFSQDFTADFTAIVGPVVVPIPVAFWLFGSGLIGLFTVARRTTT